MSYRTLDIYKISFDLFLKAHLSSLKLPKYELYEWEVNYSVHLIRFYQI